jgi:monoamine oxidase
MKTIFLLLLLFQFGTIVYSYQLFNTTNTDEPRIIIIGAGLAGVSALSKFLENGYENVLLLEAENRIGGRVETVPFGANVADIGAQWIHGEKGNVIYQMVSKHGVTDRTPLAWVGAGGTAGNFYSSDGFNRPEYGELDEMTQEITDNDNPEIETFDGPIGVYFTDQYYKFLKTNDYKHIRQEYADEFLPYFEKGQNIEDGSHSWYFTSASNFRESIISEGYENINWKDNGFHTVFDFITKKRPDPRNDLKVERKILLNKEVKNVKWDYEGKQLLRVTCADGTFYDADHVIVTVSLGVLKYNYKFMFTPQLPLYKQKAIQGLAYGTMNKILMEFDRPFWPSDWSGFGMIWTKNDLEAISRAPNSWVKDISGFFRVSYQPNILFAFTYGETARKIETLTEAELLDGVKFLFGKFLVHHIKNYTLPKKVIATNWFSRKNFRGSYSFRSIETDVFDTSAADLAEPIEDSSDVPRILFAGEATHSTLYTNAHGAVESGYREAQRIMKYYN